VLPVKLLLESVPGVFRNDPAVKWSSKVHDRLSAACIPTIAQDAVSWACRRSVAYGSVNPSGPAMLFMWQLLLVLRRAFMCVVDMNRQKESKQWMEAY